MKHTLQEIAELFESDDELPDSYVETPAIPAYQNDNRFARSKSDKNSFYRKPDEVSQLTDTRSQPWYEEQSIDVIPTEYKKSSEIHASQNILLEQEMCKGKKIQISREMLTKRDIFFVKIIENFSSASTLLWFIDYLNYKAVKPWQRSCLVADITHDAKNRETKQPIPDFNMRYYLTYVIN